MRSGWRTAWELMEVLSAPARSTWYMSSTVARPPPTQRGMNSSRAQRSSTSSMIPRPSWEAVMS